MKKAVFIFLSFLMVPSTFAISSLWNIESKNGFLQAQNKVVLGGIIRADINNKKLSLTFTCQ